MRARKMRLLRIKYQISRLELGEVCGLSPQRISEIELNAEPEATEETLIKVQSAFAAVIERRRRALEALEQDFANHKKTLLEGVEETTYEL